MSAKLSLADDMISVDIQGKLGYDCWRVLRQAREQALVRKLPLHINVACCDGGEMGGLGSLLMAREALGELTLEGCCLQFQRWFDGIGLCRYCRGKCKDGQSSMVP